MVFCLYAEDLLGVSQVLLPFPYIFFFFDQLDRYRRHPGFQALYLHAQIGELSFIVFLRGPEGVYLLFYPGNTKIDITKPRIVAIRHGGGGEQRVADGE